MRILSQNFSQRFHHNFFTIEQTEIHRQLYVDMGLSMLSKPKDVRASWRGLYLHILPNSHLHILTYWRIRMWINQESCPVIAINCIWVSDKPDSSYNGAMRSMESRSLLFLIIFWWEIGTLDFIINFLWELFTDNPHVFDEKYLSLI
jgi:hypothetical protein